MPGSSDAERGTYTSTGWRVVGAGAQRIAERAAAYGVDRLDPGNVADTLYAVRFTTDPVVRGRPAIEHLLDAITDDVRRTWPECPRLLRDEVAERPLSRFGGLRFHAFARAGREWTGEVVWRAVHPVVAGAPVTTRVVLEERKSFTRISLRVAADNGLASVRGHVGAGQAQPVFLKALRSELTPVWLGAALEPRIIGKADVPDMVQSVLSAATRAVPVVVLAPLEEGGYVIDPEDLVWELLGRASLHVLQEHRQTFELTDTLGDRRMSCYWGAARAYMPGWTRYDDPYAHPLLVGDRLGDPVMRAAWLGELGVWTGKRLELPPELRVAEAISGPPAAGSAADSSRQAAAPPGIATVTGDSGMGDSTPPSRATHETIDTDGARTVEPALEPPHPDHRPLLDSLVSEVQKITDALLSLTDEVERLRTISAVRSSSTSAIERRLARLEDILEQAFPAEPTLTTAVSRSSEFIPEDGDESKPVLTAIIRDAAEAHSDALVFLESATASAVESPYEDPERVRAILDAMARLARRRRDGLLGTSLREAFSDLGLDYRGAIARSTPARLREQYRFAHDGGIVEAEEHIVLGNTYDPRRCLRVYFSSRVPNEPRFVIGHVGRHFQVQSST